jgi:hypothetical protein
MLSAYSNLAGMFPNGTNQTYPVYVTAWPRNWSPIPVHTVAAETDIVRVHARHCPVHDAQMLNAGVRCAAADRAQDDELKTPAARAADAKYKVCSVHVTQIVVDSG